jgi:epoxyqueuosine reductase
MIAALSRQLSQRGCAARVVSINHLSELQESIEAGHRNGMFDEGLYQEYLKGFVFSPPASLPEARSLIIVAARQPQVRLTFTYQGEPRPVMVPPSYLHAAEADNKVQEMLTEILGPEGYHVVPAILPKKLLAAHSGLASYGRNNITYVEGMGSFHRLTAFYSDLQCQDGENWHALRMLERCNDCGACTRLCPSGAIGNDRFLLHAERCIVFHNEKPAAVPFPAWVDGSWHNCLVGCLLCQKACPENKPYVRSFEAGAEFTEEETALLASGAPIDQMPAALADKIEKCDLAGLMDVLPRNLRALLERS